MKSQSSLFSLFALTAIILVSLSCSNSDQTRDYINQQSNPFNLKHISYALFSKIESGKQQLYLGWQIPRSELAFAQSDSGYVSVLTVQLSIKKNDIESVWDSTFSVVTRYRTFDETRIFLNEKFFTILHAPPGNYFLYCVITEGQNTSSDMRIYSTLNIPADTSGVQLSTIRFMDDHKTDNLSLTKQLSRNNFRKPAIDFDILFRGNSEVRLQLLMEKISSDTTSARPFSALTPMSMSLEAKGFKNWEMESNIIVIDTLISGKKASQTFSYLIPDSFRQGVYLTKVKMISGDKISYTPEERFYIFPDFFPEVKTLKDAVKIVKYIAYPSEYEKMTEGGDSLLKNNFDRFWLKLADGNREAAKKKVAKFYERVNEANILFSNYKPGWKTDLGMTYILLGPPDQVQWQPSGLTWYYYFRKAGANIPFVFKPIRDENTIIGYYLERYFEYEEVWQEYRRIWEQNN